MKRLALALSCLMIMIPALADDGKFRRVSDPVPGQYIVVLNDGLPDVAAAARDLAGLHAGTVERTFATSLKGFSTRMSAAMAQALSRNPMVRFVEEDGYVSLVATQTNATWGLDRIDQRSLPLNGTYNYDFTGSGVNAYIIDTGIRRSHNEFGGRAVTGFDAITSGGTAEDCNGHGTHVAGTVGGTVYGVAKGVRLYAVRVLDCNGSGTNSGVIAGVDWVTANHVKPAVANMSLGGGASSSLDTAVRNSINSGVTYVLAAGNGDFLGRQQDACNSSPARVTEGITISATNSSDQKASWANYGNCVDWFAPGVSITSAWHSSNTATNTISGTSMAAPHTAGVAALYLEGNSGSSPQTVRDALYNLTTKNIVTSSSTTNNHLLYSLVSGGTGSNNPPTANFTFTTSDLTASFTDTSTDSDGTIASRSWNFGDGATSTATNPSKTYSAAGTYTVTLTVTDDDGATGTVSKSVTVTSGSTGSITLSASGYKTQGLQKASLTWSGATSTNVDIIRDNVKITTTSNSGSYTDNINKRGGGSYTYRVCEAGTSTCSNNATVTF